MNYSRRIIIFFVCVLLLFAVAYQVSGPAGSKADALNQKVRTEWEARVSKDWGTVYDMTTDAFKKKISRSNFVTRAVVHVENYSIKEVKILESGTEALAIINYTMNQMGFQFNTTARERWLWENGDWHLNLAFSLSPFVIKKDKG